MTTHTPLNSRRVVCLYHADEWFESGGRTCGGGGWMTGLFTFAALCDQRNLAKLAEAWPVEVEAWVARRGGELPAPRVQS